MSRHLWSDPDAFVGDPQQAVATLRGLDLPQINAYLATLARDGGIDLPHLTRLAANTLVGMSDEVHRITRQLVAPFFGRAGLACWDGTIKQGVDRALEQLASAATPDLVADFTTPLFLHVMPQVLGFSIGSDAKGFQAVETVQRITEPYLSVATLRTLDQAVALLINACPEPGGPASAGGPETLVDLLARRREALPPGLDGRYIALGFLAGSNSATQSLAFALYGLLTGPASEWREVAQPEWADRHLDRILGLYQSTRTLVRVAAEETTVAGCPFHRGAAAVVDVVKVNARLREQAVPGRSHMSFGSGAHTCPGSHLSEIVLAAALPALARRFPRLRLHQEGCRFTHTPMMQAPIALPCETDGRSGRVSNRMVDIREMRHAREVIAAKGGFVTPRMAEHLTRVAAQSGRDLSTAIHVARNAMFFMEGDHHLALRRRILEHLGPGSLRAWHGVIEAGVRSALDGLTGMRAPDIVTGFAHPVRRAAVARVLGVVPRNAERFEALAAGFQDVLQPWLSLRDLDRVQSFFREALALLAAPDRHALPVPLLSGLLADRPVGFTDADLEAVVLVLYGASFNLSHTLANSLHWILSQPPDERAAAASPGWIEQRLETLIAVCTTSKFIYRMAQEDRDLDGIPIRTGDTARLSVHAINRDAEGHLSFGHGLHSCVGAGLSRLVLRTAIPAILARFPDLSLVPHAQTYSSRSQNVALESLPVRLGRTP